MQNTTETTTQTQEVSIIDNIMQKSKYAKDDESYSIAKVGDRKSVV